MWSIVSCSSWLLYRVAWDYRLNVSSSSLLMLRVELFISTGVTLRAITSQGIIVNWRASGHHILLLPRIPDTSTRHDRILGENPKTHPSPTDVAPQPLLAGPLSKESAAMSSSSSSYSLDWLREYSPSELRTLSSRVRRSSFD